VRQLVAAFGSVEAILAAPAAAIARVPGLGPKLAAALAGWRAQVDPAAELAQADAAGIRVVTQDDLAYPVALRQLSDAPLVLYVQGDAASLAAAGERGLAVVGTRRPSLYGETVAARLAGAAAHAGLVIVSGLARGIDTVAHRSALEHHGQTVAVIGSGLLNIYPEENRGLAAEITGAGCLVSEQPLAARPDKRTFPMRNRIIAGLCPTTLVIEAATGSGALITADKAFAAGRRVAAVPGRIDSPQSQGCHALIKRGAKLVEGLDDLLPDFTFLPGLAPALPLAAGGAVPGQALCPEEARICEVLAAGDVSLDELARHTGEPVHRLLATLTGLELKRAVKQLPGRRFTRYPTGTAPAVPN
jgi:DNA processing protein